MYSASQTQPEYVTPVSLPEPFRKDALFTRGINVLRPNLLETCTLESVIHSIKTGIVGIKNILPAIQFLRDAEHKEQKQAIKLSLPWFNGSLFNGHKSLAHLTETNYLIFDLDDVADIEAIKFKAMQELDRSICLAFRSPTNGVKLVFKLDKPIVLPTHYIATYSYIAKEIEDKLHFKTDDAAKSRAQACYFSWDPDLLVNQSIIPLEWTRDEVRYQHVAEIIETRHIESSKTPDESYREKWDLAIRCVEYLCCYKIGYAEWIKCGYAIKNTFGDAGWDIWKLFANNPNYKDDLKFLHSRWRSIPIRNNVNFGSLVWVAERKGFKH